MCKRINYSPLTANITADLKFILRSIQGNVVYKGPVLSDELDARLRRVQRQPGNRRKRAVVKQPINQRS